MMSKARILNNGGFYERLDGVDFPLEVECRVEGELVKVRDDALVKVGVKNCPMTGSDYEWSFVLNSEAELIESDKLDAHLGIEPESKFKVGDECVVLNPVDTGKSIYDGCQHLVGETGVIKSIFKNKHDYTINVVEFENGACVCFVDESIGKPETPEQREERERLEAAYDLFQTANPKSNWDFDGFKGSFLIEPYLAIVDKTNYRKS